MNRLFRINLISSENKELQIINKILLKQAKCNVQIYKVQFTNQFFDVYKSKRSQSMSRGGCGTYKPQVAIYLKIDTDKRK